VEPAFGHSLQLTVRLRAPLWHLGAGWAALGGALAAGALRDPGVAVAPPLGGLLTLAWVWLLADPLLGTLWEVVACRRKVEARSHAPGRDDAGQPVPWLPYSQPGSPAWRLAAWLSGLGIAERAQPESVPTPSPPAWLGAFVLALIVAGVLGYVVLALVIVSACLSWLAVRLGDGRVMDPSGGLSPGVAALHAVGIFCIPWLIGGTAAGGASLLTGLIGVCLTIVWAGILSSPFRLRLIVGGQLALVSLLVAVHQPLAAAVVGAAVTAQWALASAGGLSAGRLRRAVQPFVLIGLIVAVLAVGV
jgi:hypothetical protein